MGFGQYKDLFIQEARDILSALNQSLVTLEQHPENRECLHEIFRQAHNLKGMAASMGYEAITTLTHELESVLDLLRQGKLEAGPSTVSPLFESCDLLEILVDRVAAATPQETLSAAADIQLVTALAAKLTQLKAGQSPEAEPAGAERRSNLRLEDTDRQEIARRIQEGATAFRVTISLNDVCALKEARALTIVKMLESVGTVIRAPYLHQQLRGGKFGRHFGLFFITNQPASAVQERIQAMPDVEAAALTPLEADEVASVGDSASATVPAAAKDAERADAPKREVHMVRVALDQLDQLMNIVGELVIKRIGLEQIGRVLGHQPLHETLTHLARLTRELQEVLMHVRLIPVDYIFNRFPRMVRDLAREEDKEINLVVEGADIGLDRTILDEINEPLVHLLRNAVNHGIEPPRARLALGKPASGTIRLAARRERNVVVIEVSDNGRGMDPAELQRVAVEKGLITAEEAAGLDDEETLMLVTIPGFSTARVVTKTSGRGVGMNSVRTKVESFGGTLTIESTPRIGSTFTLRLPLTMAIIQALMVKVAQETYAIPLVNISAVIKITPASIKLIEHHEVVTYRESVLPLIRLRQRFGFGVEARGNAPHESTDGQTTADRGLLSVVVVEAGHRLVGLVVDQLLGQQEIVIKVLQETLKRIEGIAGATILGDGKVAMIVDVASVV